MNKSKTNRAITKAKMRCLPGLFLSISSWHAYAQNNISELGGLPQVGTSAASSINGAGDVVVGNYTSSSNTTSAFRWIAATNSFTDLGFLPGGVNSSATAVNANGDVVVGFSSTSTSFERAFRWTSATGRMTDLGVLPGGFFSAAEGVNAAGDVVVGSSGSSNGLRAFRWTAATNSMTDLGVLPGGTFSSGRATNAAGDVVVGSSGPDTNSEKAFRWTSATNTMNDLGVLPGDLRSAAYATNAAGDVVVGSSIGQNAQRAFRWTVAANSMTDLGALSGGNSTIASATNAAGDVVVGGSGMIGNQRAFRWTDATGMQSVEEWLTTNGVAVGNNISTTFASGVSADGDVVVGTLSNRKAFVARVNSQGQGGLIDVQEFNNSLQATVQANSIAYANTDLILNGLHGKPTRGLLDPGKSAFWVSGDWDLKDGANDEQNAVGEFGVKSGIDSGWEGEVSLGRQYSRGNTLNGGKNTLRGTYIAPGISFQVPDSTLIVGLLTYYGRGTIDLNRGYMNAGLPDSSSGSPNIQSVAARLRVDWVNALTVGSVAVTPYTSFTASKFKIDSYTESSGGFPVKWASRKDAAKVVRVGVDNTWQATSALSFTGRIEYANRLDPQGERVTGQAIGLNPFSLDGYRYQKNWMRFGLGGEYKLDSTSSVSATLSTTTQSDQPKNWMNMAYTKNF